MKRAAIAFGFVFLCFGTNLHTADGILDISGTWICSEEMSDPSPRVTPIGRAAGPNTPLGRPPGAKQPAGRAPLPKRPIPGRAGNQMPGPRPPVAGRVGGGMRGGPPIGGGTFDGTSRVAKDVPLVITQTDTEIAISNALLINDVKVSNIEKYRLDGQEHEQTISDKSGEEITRITKTTLKKNKLEIEAMTINAEGKRIKTTREFTLSNDGRTLTVKASLQSPLLLSSEKIVYDRQ